MEPPMTSSASILIVEDDESLRLTLEDILEDEGYCVTVASDLASAAKCLHSSTYELIILDIMLPDGDGYQFCQQIRAQGNHSLVLMLTARSLEDDLVKGFDVGADDYLIKPYRVAELLARIRALLKRLASEMQNICFEINHFSVDRDARTVKNQEGSLVDLTPKEFDLLLYLWDNPQRAHSRDRILDQVWGEVVVDFRTVDNFVSNLKKKLSLRVGSPVYIETVRGVGYRLEK
jgi:DNA-binding response OmpR family regulator